MSEPHQQGIRTSALLRRLFRTRDLERFIESHSDEMTMPPFHVYISQLCRASGQVQEKIIKRAALDRTYGHQLFNGTRKPSRDKVIQLAFGFGLDVDGAQELLKLAQKSAFTESLKMPALGTEACPRKMSGPMCSAFSAATASRCTVHCVDSCTGVSAYAP